MENINIFKELIKIEEDAALLTREAEKKFNAALEPVKRQKEQLEKEYREKTRISIEEYKKNADKETSAEIEALNAAAKSRLFKIKSEFEKNSGDWESEIFKRIIGK